MLYQDFDDACTRSILTILHVLKEEKEMLSLYLGIAYLWFIWSYVVMLAANLMFGSFLSIGNQHFITYFKLNLTM